MTQARRVINGAHAAKLNLPISQAVAHNGVLYVGGQAGLDRATGQPVSDSFDDQFRQAMNNLQEVARAAGTAVEQALKVTIYIVDIGNYKRLNELYAEVFADEPPARKVICCDLLEGLHVELDAIIAIPAN